MEFADRLAEVSRSKKSLAILGVDPQLDSAEAPGVPPGYTLTKFCCEIIEACEKSIVAVKPQLAFFEARGIDGMRVLAEVLRFARGRGLITIADAKRGDIGSTSAAYAEAFLGDGDFSSDAITINPYLGADAIMPFVKSIRAGRGVFVLVKNSNPSSGEFQDLEASGKPLWEAVAGRVRGWGDDYLGSSGLSSIGAVVGATYPKHLKRARELMPNAIILVPGYGTQGGTANDAVMAARADGSGIIVNSSRGLMYAFLKKAGANPGAAAAAAAESMRLALNAAIESTSGKSGS
jgi:orotidine-5'-phosphate decarboxylase